MQNVVADIRGVAASMYFDRGRCIFGIRHCWEAEIHDVNNRLGEERSETLEEMCIKKLRGVSAKECRMGP